MPTPTHVAKLGEGYAVFMEGTGGRLHTWSGNRILGVELCGETQDSCRYAVAVAARVRYAWSDAPVVNLFDGRGLPIPGFELPIDP
jgi:sialate O-acetylesterase